MNPMPVARQAPDVTTSPPARAVTVTDRDRRSDWDSGSESPGAPDPGPAIQLLRTGLPACAAKLLSSSLLEEGGDGL